MGEIKANDIIQKIEEIMDEYGDDLNIKVQVPSGTKCWETSWTEFGIDCVSTDGGTIYLQCS